MQYANDGSEFLQDSIVFEIEFSTTSGSALPDFLHMRQRFLLQISVRPLNDIPRLDVLDRVIKIASGTRKQLQRETFEISDPDSSPVELTISLAAASQKICHVENDRFPGQKRKSFTVADLNAGMVYLVYDDDRARPVGISDVGLTIADGRDVGNSVVVQVESFTLQIFAVNNTGLVVTAGSTQLLTSYNLTFTTNAPEQSLNLR